MRFSAAYAPTFLNARTETTSKGKLLDIFKTIKYKPRRGGERKVILHILEALQTAPRKDANTFQAGSLSYSHDIPSIKQFCRYKNNSPFAEYIYIFRRTDGFVVRYIRNEVSLPV